MLEPIFPKKIFTVHVWSMVHIWKKWSVKRESHFTDFYLSNFVRNVKWEYVYIFQWSIWEVRNVKFCVKRELNFWKNGLLILTCLCLTRADIPEAVWVWTIHPFPWSIVLPSDSHHKWIRVAIQLANIFAWKTTWVLAWVLAWQYWEKGTFLVLQFPFQFNWTKSGKKNGLSFGLRHVTESK